MRILVGLVFTLLFCLFSSGCNLSGLSVAPNLYRCNESENRFFLMLEKDGKAGISLNPESLRIVKDGSWVHTDTNQLEIAFIQESHYQLIDKDADLYEEKPSLITSTNLSLIVDVIYYDASQIDGLEVQSSNDDKLACLTPGNMLSRVQPY